jgi:hypothetical protein
MGTRFWARYRPPRRSQRVVRGARTGVMFLVVAVAMVGGAAAMITPASASTGPFVSSRPDARAATLNDEWMPSHLNRDGFGYSTAMSGRTAVVSAPFEFVRGTSEGEVFVFERRPTGWVQRVTLKPSDGRDGDQFGRSVAIDRETIVVGAPGHGFGADDRAGAVYVFAHTSEGWQQTAELRASDAGDSDAFGLSVAISGNVILAGAYSHAVDGRDQEGAAYVYTNDGSGWPLTESQELTAADGHVLDWFGMTVAVSGSTAVVGAVYADGGAGSAYVYSNIAGTWTNTQELTASDAQSNAIFGSSIAISTGTIMIGAPLHDVGTSAMAGTVYVFTYDGTTWNQLPELADPAATANDDFGASVALDGDRALLGATSVYGIGDTPGVVYAYKKKATWKTSATLTPSDGTDTDGFGFSVALSGARGLVGAPFLATSTAPFGAEYVSSLRH